MLPDWVSNPGPLTYKSDALPIALRGLAQMKEHYYSFVRKFIAAVQSNNICACHMTSLPHL